MRRYAWGKDRNSIFLECGVRGDGCRKEAKVKSKGTIIRITKKFEAFLKNENVGRILSKVVTIHFLPQILCSGYNIKNRLEETNVKILKRGMKYCEIQMINDYSLKQSNSPGNEETGRGVRRPLQVSVNKSSLNFEIHCTLEKFVGFCLLTLKAKSDWSNRWLFKWFLLP